MGEIFLAVTGEVGGFEKICVIKKVLAEQADESKTARFLDEAKVVIRLSHTNLVSVFDVGRVDDEYYIAMEFIEGHDLGAVWNKCAEKKARFPVDIALFIIREVLRGLAYAHTYGGLNLVHRDVTPPNIMISYYGEVKLTDFGLARSRLKQEFTAPGIVYGRLAYLAPEQARGTAVDARTDLYSVGIILWELLTGTQLFRVSAADPVTAISIVRNPQIDPPSKKVPRLPKSLDDLVMKALAVSPADRFQTAEDMRRAVAAELAALAPTIDEERVASFMRMLYGEEIEKERAERERLLGRDRSGMFLKERETVSEFPSKKGGPSSATVSGELESRPRDQQRKGMRTRTIPPLVEVVGLRPKAEKEPKKVREPASPTVRIGPTSQPQDADKPRAKQAEAPREERKAQEPRDRVGDLVDGRYRLRALIGAGAMGAVYDAEHVDIGKRVALKVLHPQYSRNADLVARFRREARAASMIGHPNIVDVTDFGTTKDGCAYFVMERLEGEDLKEVLVRERTLDPSRAVAIAVQVCRAAHAAHQQGIVHRDLKPENIFLIERDGNPDFVKILDFGIAKSSTLEHADGRALTLPGIAMGTPVYMAPEQATGEGTDARVDVYAVGAILYEMLTGVPPIDGEDVLDIMTRKTTEDPPPPSSLNPDIPPQLDAIVMKALARERTARYQSMEELEHALLEVSAPRATPHDGLLGIMASQAGQSPATRGGRGVERSALSDGGAGRKDKNRVSPQARKRGASREVPPGPSEDSLLVDASRDVRPVIEFVPPPRKKRGRTWILPVVAMAGLGALVGLGAAVVVMAGGAKGGQSRKAVPAKVVDAGRQVSTDGAVAVAALDGGLFVPGSDGGSAQGPASTKAPTLTEKEVGRLLAAAKRAARAGRFIEPPGECVRDILDRIEEARPKEPRVEAFRQEVAQELAKDGAAALSKRRHEEAEKAFRAVLALVPADERAAKLLGETLVGKASFELRRRHFKEASEAAKEAVALGDKSGAAHLLLGEALMALGNAKEAVEALEQAVELRPKSKEARTLLRRAKKLAAQERGGKGDSRKGGKVRKKDTAKHSERAPAKEAQKQPEARSQGTRAQPAKNRPR